MSEPTMAWHPKTGENKIFNSSSEVPEGWLDTHPNNVAEKSAPDMTRKEIIAALSSGGIQFDERANKETLYEVLTDAVKKALTEAEITFNPALTTKQLLDLLPSPE